MLFTHHFISSSWQPVSQEVCWFPPCLLPPLKWSSCVHGAPLHSLLCWIQSAFENADQISPLPSFILWPQSYRLPPAPVSGAPGLCTFDKLPTMLFPDSSQSTSFLASDPQLNRHVLREGLQISKALSLGSLIPFLNILHNCTQCVTHIPVPASCSH